MNWVLSFATKVLALGVCGFALKLLSGTFAGTSAAASRPAPLTDRVIADKLAFSGRGRILNAEGGPADGALVRVSDDAGRVLERTTTQANGNFRLTRTPKRFRIWVAHPTQGSVRSDWLSAQGLAEGRADPLVLVLVPSVEWSGNVVDGNGDPIADAELRAAPANCTATQADAATQEDCATIWVRADSHGHFSLRMRAAGTYEITAWARAFAPRRLVIDLTSAATPERITLSSYGAVRGRVLAPDGQAVPDAIVRVCEEDELVELVSARDGSFVVSPDKIGCDVVAYHPRFAHSMPVRVRGGHALALQLSPGGAIQGWATNPSGFPSRDLAIEITDYTPPEGEPVFTSDRFGASIPIGQSFRLSSLAPGTYAARVSRRSSDADSPAAEAELSGIQVQPGAVTRGVQIILPDDSSE